VTLSDQEPISKVCKIFDTQIISYAIKDRWPEGIKPQDISRGSISSVTAHELLRVRLSDTANRPRYYLYGPLVPELVGDNATLRKYDREHKRLSLGAKRRTDQVILDFGADFPVVVEYGHLMIGWLLKHKRLDAYARRVAHLDKQERAELIGTFSYLMENDLRCLSLDSATAQIGIDLLHRYAMSGGNNLKANFRNSLNDMLILATSMNSGMSLLTEDRALLRFAAHTLSLPFSNKGELVELGTSSSAKPALVRESKGYINRPWEAYARNRATRLI